MMDPALAATAVTEQVAMCIQLGLLCTQGDPGLRPAMRRVVVMLSKRPGHMDEPTRPGMPGSRYRIPHRRSALSSAAGTSGQSDSHTFDSSNEYTNTTTTTARTTRELDARGKRPIQG